MNTDWKADRIGSALRGENPTVLRRLSTGFAIIGDMQFLPGYCVLVTDDPAIQRVSDLPRPRRLDFLAEMICWPRRWNGSARAAIRRSDGSIS
jgi:hypothetical protein